ncbi:catalase [Nocardiopsis coralliicola]
MPAEPSDAKDCDLERARSGGTGPLTTDTGVPVDHTDDSLQAGERGPTLLEDFHFREKLTHFDHERIPERVVHARGAGAYGRFRPYRSFADLTCARFLSGPEAETPVFVRFSTVAGSRGSADTVRDVRGFAVKFYTDEGNFDLVGNNMPVFFIQDGIKFPDFVHAVKPEPRSEIPQAQSAHDTLWDFVGQQPETMHMIMWLMSDRALPRSYRMMQGFGVHTFRFVDSGGRGTFVKFHWKPLLGTHSLVWEECQRLQGADPDFNRRDLWDAIEAGRFPEWELGVQLIAEEDEHAFDVDLLDPTKIIPEETVPVTPVGRLVLDRNPDEFFAETEQVAFHTANIVPGIDFSNDPLLQARNFSYLDTQLIRLGGPNFQQLPVNRPVAPVDHDQRDGYGQHRIHRRPTAYTRNTLGGGCPAIASEGVFRHYQERVDGPKIRRRSPSFDDHHTQAGLFYNSLADWERAHLQAAFQFELGKCTDRGVRERAVAQIARVDRELAQNVAAAVGVEAEDAGPGTAATAGSSPALSQSGAPSDTAATRSVAVLAADGADLEGLRPLLDALRAAGAGAELVAPAEGPLRTAGGETADADRALPTVHSVVYDAVVVPAGCLGGLAGNGRALHFASEAFRHHKPVAALGDGVDLLARLPLPDLALAGEGSGPVADQGVLTARPTADTAFAEHFLRLLAGHRVWDRATAAVPA